jgi:hypothetical protein
MTVAMAAARFPMSQLNPFFAAAVVLTMATPAAANDIADACRQFANAEVIFVGRVKSAPIVRRISGEQEIENARLVMDAAERELKAFEALKMPPEIGATRHYDLAVRAIEARGEYTRTRAMHPPPMDVSLTPVLVEERFRGVTTAELFIMNMGQPQLDPAKSYLFYSSRPLGPLAPDVISSHEPKEVEAVEADLRFLRDAVANDLGTVVHGSLKMEDPDDQQRRTPLSGVVLRISLGDQRMETSTGADGTFMLAGVPPGTLTIEPALPEHLTLPSQTGGGESRGGCLEVHMRAILNGRIRGRVLLDSGKPFRGIVDLVRHGHARHLSNSIAHTNDNGEFAFSAVPPGSYLLGINVSRQPSSSAPFRPTYFPGTTDRALAMPVVVGLGTEHSELEWVVSSRLREGSIEVSFDSNGQLQKAMGVCVTMFDADLRNNGGFGYERQADEPVVVNVVEGVRYRLVAHARLATGFAESEIFDVIGTPGRQRIELSLASVSEKALGHPCPSASSSKPFSPSR